MTWRDKARPLVREAIREVRAAEPDLTTRQVQRRVNACCPIRDDVWPLRIWRDETRRQLGLKPPRPPRPVEPPPAPSLVLPGCEEEETL